MYYVGCFLWIFEDIRPNKKLRLLSELLIVLVHLLFAIVDSYPFSFGISFTGACDFSFVCSFDSSFVSGWKKT